MLAPFLDDVRQDDLIAPRRLAERLRLPMSRLAKIAHVNRNTMAARPESPAVQAKLGQIAAIIAKASELSGDEGAAVIWFKYQTMASWGRTPEDVVELGYADAVLEELERMAEGVYS